MIAKSPTLVAVALFAAFGFSTAFADVKRVTKGRSGTVVAKAAPKPEPQVKANSGQRVKTVALMPDEKKKRRTPAGGRGR